MRFALWVVVALLPPWSALADAAASAAEARAAEASLDYDVATDIWMTVLGDPSATDEQLQEAHLRSGILQRIRGNDTAARLHFRYVLQRDIEHRLPDDTSPKVSSYFDMVREEVRAEQAIAVRAAAAPGPVAQANGAVGTRATQVREDEDPPLLWWGTAGAGVLLLVAGGALAAVGVVPALTARDANARADEARGQVERSSLYDERDESAAWANSLFAVGGVVSVVGFGLAAVGITGAL